MTVLEGFIAQYGVLVVFIGAALEGETMVVLAGFLAH
jgi:membrane protein DedA with SNARE-associated domain